MAVQTPPSCVREWLPVLLLCLTTLLPALTRAAVTCTAVTTRINTTITCHFGQNIGKTLYNFNLQFYYPNDTASPKTLLMCNFAQTGELVCHEEAGIRFDRVVTDQAEVVAPPAVDKMVGGQYACQVLPALPDGHTVPCSLTYQEIPTTHLTSPKTDSASAQHSEHSSLMPHLQIATFVLVLLMALLLLLRALIILYRRCQRTRGSGSRGLGSEGDNSDLLDQCCFLLYPAAAHSGDAPPDAIPLEASALFPTGTEAPRPASTRVPIERGRAVDPGRGIAEEEFFPTESLLENSPEGHQISEAPTESGRSPRRERDATHTGVQRRKKQCTPM